MARKKKPEEHVNHERWLVSYADFITLLFAFFVVMYSVSSVNEGRYRAVSNSIRAALRPIVSAGFTPLPFQVGNPENKLTPPKVPQVTEPIFKRITEAFSKLPGRGSIQTQVHATRTSRGIVLTIQDHVLFEPGAAVLHPDALPFLQALAEVLIEFERHVEVVGHTDNVPISTAAFPTNWELSAARAVIVVRILTDLYQVDPATISAKAAGEYQPVAENATKEGREKNRRVEVIVEQKYKEWKWYSGNTH